MSRNSKYYEAVEKAKEKSRSASPSNPKNNQNERSDLKRWSKYYINEDKFTDYAPYGRNKNGTPFNKDGRPIGGGDFDRTGFDPTGKSDSRRYEDTIISKDEWNHLGRAFNKYFSKDKDRHDNRMKDSKDDFRSRYYDTFLEKHQSRGHEYIKALRNYEDILSTLKSEYENERRALLAQKEEALRQRYVENELQNKSDSQRFASMGIAEGDEYAGNLKNDSTYNLKRRETIKNYDKKLKDLEEKKHRAQSSADNYFENKTENLQKQETEALLKSSAYKKALSLYSNGKNSNDIERALREDYIDDDIIRLLIEQLDLNK